MVQYELTVDGMACTGGERTVTNVVKHVGGIHRDTADNESETVEITAEEGIENAIRQAIHDAGDDLPV